MRKKISLIIIALSVVLITICIIMIIKAEDSIKDFKSIEQELNEAIEKPKEFDIPPIRANLSEKEIKESLFFLPKDINQDVIINIENRSLNLTVDLNQEYKKIKGEDPTEDNLKYFHELEFVLLYKMPLWALLKNENLTSAHIKVISYDKVYNLDLTNKDIEKYYNISLEDISSSSTDDSMAWWYGLFTPIIFHYNYEKSIIEFEDDGKYYSVKEFANTFIRYEERNN